jgi:hypothetical protein
MTETGVQLDTGEIVETKALKAGYRHFPAIDADPSLRSDPRFQQLIQRYRR